MDKVEVRYKILQKYYKDNIKKRQGVWMICGASSLPKVFLNGVFDDVLYSVSQMDRLWKEPNIKNFSIKEIKIYQAGSSFKQSVENKIIELKNLIASKKKEIDDISPQIYKKEGELNEMKFTVGSIKDRIEEIQEEIDGYTKLF